MTSLTRRYRFSASHRLHAPSLTDRENELLYGKCNHPFGHGHDYVLEVTASGPVDPVTGLILRISELDRLVADEVLQVFAFRNINLDIPRFASLVPTTENIAAEIAALLQQRWSKYLPPDVQLRRVHVQETDRNGFEVLLPTANTDLTTKRAAGVLNNA